jgi:PPOX class probable F420-dependent enzyme
MPMKMRDAIRMNEAEIAATLGECRHLQVATLDRDGAPHLTTLWFAFHEGAFLFETYGKSQKVVNLRRDPRLAVLCEQGERYDELRGVSVQGRAEIVDAGERQQALMEVLVARHQSALDSAEVAVVAASMCEKRVVVVVRPDKVISWDHRKLAIG